jgi:NAD(P)-dependent dehydrogenase (short-subunit alcohol dehydrogenase family)
MLSKEKIMPTTLMCNPKLLQKDLSGRIYIVTGANSGSGLATATQLAKQGATVVGACRRVDAGKEAFAELNARGSVEIMKLDLASLASVRQFADAFLAKYDRLDGLVNNAGLICPQSTTEDGFGIQFAINYLGHFLLTELLLDTLKASAPSRIIDLSSVMHAYNGIELHFDDLDFVKRPYNANQAYSEAKLAVVLQSVDLAQRLEGTGVTAVSVHPGAILSGWGRQMMPAWVRSIMTSSLLKPLHGPMGMLTPFEGAQTTLHCLLDEDVPNHSGEYYSQHSMLYPNRENRPGGWPMPSPNPHAHDKALAEKLYHRSLDLVGLKN